MYYKKYQQVIDLSVGAKSAKNEIVKNGGIDKHRGEKNIKKRTKTGCLTCRKRKKKCDEDKVDGKCQGCTRNFLQCHWPGAAIPATIGERKTRTEVKNQETPNDMARKAYPSPILSPSSTPKLENMHIESEINKLTLPPPFDNYKLPKNDRLEAPQMPVTSTKFVITSFDSNMGLCHVSSG